MAALYAYESVERPSVTIRVKTVQVDMQVEPGKNYQLVSQDFNVVNGPRFFRLVEVP